MNIVRRDWLASGLAGLLLLQPLAAHAMRYVEFNITLGNRTVLKASTGDKGLEDADTVWRYLGRLPLRIDQSYAVTPDPGKPLRATLKGKIWVSCNQGGQASLGRLRLVRDRPGGNWKIHPEDARIAFKRRKGQATESGTMGR